jgi:hypothetical protein
MIFLRTFLGGIDMPLDALMLSLAVVVVFLGFAAVLAWADRQTSGLLPEATPEKPVGFERAA